MPEPLVSSRSKLGRAGHHLDALKVEINEFWRVNHDCLRSETERGGLEIAYYLRLREHPDLVRWALLLGDGLHGLRCALDHAVYELAIRASGQTPPPAERSLQFPITDDPGNWANAMRRIKPLHRDAKTVIHNAQPFRSDEGLARSPLRLLREFDDADKHRLLTPMLCSWERVMIEIEGPATLVEQGIAEPLEPLENNAKIAWVVFTQPDVKVNFGSSISIALAHDTTQEGFTHTRIGPLIDPIRAEVGRVIDALEATA